MSSELGALRRGKHIGKVKIQGTLTEVKERTFSPVSQTVNTLGFQVIGSVIVIQTLRSATAARKWSWTIPMWLRMAMSQQHCVYNH